MANRKGSTKAQQELNALLKRLGLKLESRYRVGKFRLEVAVPGVCVAFEAVRCEDNCAFCREEAAPRREGLAQRRREGLLKNLGWRLLRFPRCELHMLAKECLAKVAEEVEHRVTFRRALLGEVSDGLQRVAGDPGLKVG